MIKFFLFSVAGLVVGGCVFYMAAGAEGLQFGYSIVPASFARVPFAEELPVVEPLGSAEPAKTVSLSSATMVGKPVRLTIPAIKVNAAVEHLGLTPQGAVAAPEGPREVSWFNLGARPGEAGSVLISGHSGIWRDTTTSVFDNLHKLKPGDRVSVTDDRGITRQFEVTELRVYGKDDSVSELFTKTGSPHLNIITCHGTWLPTQKTYDKRLVVSATLIK